MAGNITAATTVEPTGEVGRPSSLSEATRKALLGAILDLHTMDDAFRLAGIAPSTGNRWLAKGRKASSGQYRELLEQVEHAKARAKHSLQKVVMARGRIDAKMALEVLSRRYPEWQRRQKVEMEDKTPASKRDGVRERMEALLDRIEERKVKGVAMLAAAESEAERDAAAAEASDGSGVG